MDYKKMIEQLKYYGTTYAIGDNLGREIDGTDQVMMEAATAIETLLAEREAAGWISVNDRLPEDDPTIEKHVEGDSFMFLTVLVYNGVVKQANRFFCNAPKLGLPKTDGWEWTPNNVTHWMPLPTPPDRERTER